MAYQGEELDYGVTVAPTVDLPEESVVSNVDEANYNTLKDVQKSLRGIKHKLFSDFNTFNIDPNESEDTQIKKLRDDILIRQGVWALMEPEIEKIDSAIEAVNIKRSN